MIIPERPESKVSGSALGGHGESDARAGRTHGEHKPSRKHTLEEVLKSLQDLIRNDLLDEPRPAIAGKVHDRPAADDGAAASASPLATFPDKSAGSGFGQRGSAGPERGSARGEPQGRGEHKSAGSGFGQRDSARGEFQAGGGRRFDLPEVIESLEELVTTDLDIGEVPAPAVPHQARPAPAMPPEGLQPELPLFDEAPAEAPVGPRSGEEQRQPVVTVPTDTVGALVPEAIDRDGDRRPHEEEIVLEEIAAAREAALKGPIAEPGANEPPVELPLDDLRVETEALPPGDDPHHDDIPVLEDIALPAPPSQAPLSMAPEQAHAIAVKTVARLNVELRKRGEAPLDVKLVKRLELILREVLENAGSK